MPTTPAAILGQVLLWLGFLGGSFVSVQRLENELNPWHTVPWWNYGAFVTMGVAGIVMMRSARAAHRVQKAAAGIGLEVVQQHLIQAAQLARQLNDQLPEMSCEDVLAFIDDQCEPHMSEFAEGRMLISDRLGTTTYAAVMTEFASGERYLNRAWSAAADGYVDEVELSVRHARDFLSAAVAGLDVSG